MLKPIPPLALIAFALAACEREAPEQVAATEAPITADTAVPIPATSASPDPALSQAASKPAPPVPSERRDPDRVLRDYADALAARDWAAAAKAWARGSGVTATTLKAAYDRAEPPVLEVGKGEVEGAAGSLYYEAPVALRFGTATPERGSLVLRRVNDVDGASAEQLRWHIERSTIGQGQ